MVANTNPIYTLTPNTVAATLVTALTTRDMSSANAVLLFTAGANGGFVKHIRLRGDQGVNTTATKVAIFLNNGGTSSTTTNNFCYDEISFAGTTASTSAATAGTEIPMNIPLPATWRVFATTHTTVTALHITCVGGDY